MIQPRPGFPRDPLTTAAADRRSSRICAVRCAGDADTAPPTFTLDEFTSCRGLEGAIFTPRPDDLHPGTCAADMVTSRAPVHPARPGSISVHMCAARSGRSSTQPVRGRGRAESVASQGVRRHPRPGARLVPWSDRPCAPMSASRRASPCHLGMWGEPKQKVSHTSTWGIGELPEFANPRRQLLTGSPRAGPHHIGVGRRGRWWTHSLNPKDRPR